MPLVLIEALNRLAERHGYARVEEIVVKNLPWWLRKD